MASFKTKVLSFDQNEALKRAAIKANTSKQKYVEGLIKDAADKFMYDEFVNFGVNDER